MDSYANVKYAIFMRGNDYYICQNRNFHMSKRVSPLVLG